MKLLSIYETDITKTKTASKIGTELGKGALDVVSDLTGLGLAKKAGEMTMTIISLLKTKKDASKLIMKAMSLPDSDREELNIFDIDDNLWGPDGILNEKSQTDIFKLVKARLDILVKKGNNLPKNFANNIAIKYVKSKIGI